MQRPQPRGGILAGPVDGPERARELYPERAATAGLAVVHRASRFRGTVVRFEMDGIVLRGTTGGERLFRLAPGGFSLDGETVTLVKPRPTAAPGATRTASGSVAPTDRRARVARASRILVEGVHDAELVEKVWGDDLRAEAIVVERLDGLDDLEHVVRTFAPGPGRRLGILVDHLVAGSKESRIVTAVQHPHVLVTGTPFVDIWQAIRPAVAGIDAWPAVPKGRPWKEGICEALGVAEPGALWRQLLGKVSTFADLEPVLVGAVEQLIDFLTEDQARFDDRG